MGQSVEAAPQGRPAGHATAECAGMLETKPHEPTGLAAESAGLAARRPQHEHEDHAEPAFEILQRSVPFAVIHVLCLGVVFVGFSWAALIVALAMYAVRMFAITAFYHRYFAHRSFSTSRWFAFVAGFIGTMSAQRGPVWWAGHHREHHRHSDEPPDLHSPRQRGLLEAHAYWFNTRRGSTSPIRGIPDLLSRPELLWLERWHLVGPALLAVGMFLLGAALQRFAPALGTSGPQMFVWGFAISTTVLYHGTFTINSLAHRLGSRRFRTRDDSRNNFLLAVLTFGEGWHNNHHYHPGSARQGFYWWELDLTYYTLRALSLVGLVWGLNRVPDRVYAAAIEHRSMPDHVR